MIIKSNVYFPLVGKCTNCTKWRSFIISMNFSPSDSHNGEPDFLRLSVQAISPNLKSPRTWSEGFIAFMNIHDLFKLTF